MTRIELTNFFTANFETDDIPTSTINLVVSNVLSSYNLTDITTSDLIEACSKELNLQSLAHRGRPFTTNGNKYRILEGLLVDDLQIKVGHRYQHLSYVQGVEDAFNVIHGRHRPILE